MMAVHVGDTGTVLTKTVKNSAGAVVDVSASTTIELVVRHPDGTETTITGSFVTNGTNGQIRFTTVAGTWSKPGEWFEQVRLVTATEEWRCKAESRIVLPAL